MKKQKAAVLPLEFIAAQLKESDDFPGTLGTLAFMLEDLLETCEESEIDTLFGLIRKAADARGYSADEAITEFKEALSTARKGRQERERQDKKVEQKKPNICVNDETLDTVADEAWKALLYTNKPVRLMQRSGEIVRVERDENGITVRELTVSKMRHEIARAATFYKTRAQDGMMLCFPPAELAADMLSVPVAPVPVLKRIVRCPVFNSEGQLETEPGYSEISRNFHAPPEGFEAMWVSPEPSLSEIAEAFEFFVDNVLIDFPFRSKSDRAAAVALWLQPFVREMINGPVPVYLLDSSMNGSGKSMLGECLLYPSQLKWPALVSEIGNPEEMEKLLSAILLTRDPIVFIDNISKSVASGIFANYITATTKKCRRLGKTEVIEIPVEQTWVMAGANIDLTNENARRSLQIRLEPNTGTPELRQNFKHPFLKRWIVENQRKLVWAAHTLIQYWIAQGKPAPKGRSLGSFESWHYVMGGILESIGVTGFLGNIEQFNAESNTERQGWTEFVGEWWSNYQDNRVSAKDLLSIAEGCDGLNIEATSERGRESRLGRALRANRQRIFSTYKIVRAGVIKGTASWKLELVTPDEN